MARDKNIEAVPQKFTGKWIAWDHDCRQIVASGRTFQDAVKAARKAGEPDPVFDKIPDVDGWFVGTSL